MAENILGILLVTSTSRGRNVFRYPPDPSSPSPRLNQPIYSHTTYTTQHINTASAPRQTRLFPDALDGRLTSSASGPSFRSRPRRLTSGRDGSHGYAESSDGASTRRGDTHSNANSNMRSGDDSAWILREQDSDSSDEGSDGDEADLRLPFAGKRIEEEVIKAKETAEGLIMINTRRGSGNKGKQNGDTKADDKGDEKKHFDQSIEQQYSTALGYSLDALSDMLTPPRSACNRRFELNADEVVFIGHPVSIDADGKWRFPEEDRAVDESPVRGEERGRRRDAVGLRTVRETSEGVPTPDIEKSDPIKADAQKTDSEDDCPTLNMFHLVVLVDKPDPKIPSLGQDGVTPSDKYDEIYREIAFKWTAAAYDLQVRTNFMARESWEMARMRERFMSEGQSIIACTAYMYHYNPLEHALQDFALALHKYRNTPVNPLYAHLTTTLSVELAGTVINMTLSPRYEQVDEPWARWDYGDEMDRESSVSSDSDEGVFGGTMDDVEIQPWQTLLLVDDDTRLRAKEVASMVVGTGSSMVNDGIVGQSGSSSANGLDSRRGSQIEEDEAVLMTALILACDVTKPLMDIAHILRYDLDGIAIPLAKLLVQNRIAVPIQVLNHRLRAVVLPTSHPKHAETLEDDSLRFSRQFPTLPPLPAYLAQITSNNGQFRNVVPSDVGTDIGSRQPYLDSLIWLLQNDLVIQARTRIRIFARPEVKEIAWKRLWHRRRERWLMNRAGSTRSGPSSMSGSTSRLDDDLITPRADKRDLDPLETASTVSHASSRAPTRPASRMQGVATAQGPTSATPTYMTQSYMDYDPELELDSDVGEGEGKDEDKLDSMKFTMDRTEPRKDEIPHFEASIIYNPVRAIKEEARWLRVIREVADEVWASKFDICVQYFDGHATYEEICYRTGLRTREIDWIVERLFKEDVIVLVHP